MRRDMHVAFAEGAITHLRRERKVLLEAGEQDAIWDRLCRELRGLPMGPTKVTTIYFDRPGLPLARRARDFAGDCVKVRVKEYSPDREGDGSRVVLEVKRERDGLTTKERVWVPRSRVRWLLSGVLGQAFSVRDPRLSPVVAVRYQRQIFQTCASWRVTLDRAVTCHRVAWSALDSDAEPASRRVAPAFVRDDRAILELKYVGDEVPPWLAAIVDSRAQPFSKFVHAIAQLHETTGG